VAEAERKGLIFDIERFSTVDGPGIRTVTFFKGCNMKCLWCHNPEGICRQSSLLFTKERCIGCGECFRICPRQAHRMGNNGHVIDRKRCNKCFACVDECPANALERSGKPWTVEALCKELMQDKRYFHNSGGGVTLSGGEMMCQVNFAQAVLKALHSEKIHTAVETNLSFPLIQYEKLRPYLDLLIFDIKCIDDDKHRQGTGITNETILKNVSALTNPPWNTMPLIVRTAIIPSFNDSPEEIFRIAAMLSKHTQLRYYELLAYHPLGIEKSIKLGGKTQRRFEVPTHEQMLMLAEAAAEVLGHVRVNGKEIRKGR